MRKAEGYMNKIGIIGAMEVEVARLKEDMTITRTLTKARMEFFEGTLGGKGIVVVRSGVGKVNAAVCTQILADEFGVDGVINTGVAGSLDASIDIGDVVISTDVIHHDVNATLFGYAPGQVPQMPVVSFEANEAMAQKACEVCGRVNPDIRVHRGRVVSGDQFIDSRETKNHIHEVFGGACCEMEGAAIAQTAYLNELPFIVVRAISDKADDSASVDYPVFENAAAQRSVKLMEALIPEL